MKYIFEGEVSYENVWDRCATLTFSMCYIQRDISDA